MKKQLHTLTFARCGCPAIHWAVRGSFIGCAECREANRCAPYSQQGLFAVQVVVTYRPRLVKREINAAKTQAAITAIIERENATLPRGRAA
jgi:hypothetical protein